MAHVPKLDEAQVVALVDRARAAQPAWAALGFRERAGLMLDLRAWVVKNRKQVAEALMAEAGKTFEDGLVEVTYACEALGFWAKKAEKYLKDKRMRPQDAAAARPHDHHALRAARRHRRDRAVELPASCSASATSSRR